jgi:hypothetical protein
MSDLSKERVEYLQKIVKKEVVQCPREKRNRKKKQGKYWYLERQDFLDWKRWMDHIDKINEEAMIKWNHRPVRIVGVEFSTGRPIGERENIPAPVKLDYWEPQQPRDLVVVIGEEVTALDPIIHLY